MPENETLQSFITELRRGTLTLAVLGALSKPRYGYALLQTMQQENIDIEANTLYPLLRRLESQGLLSSDWDTSESRPRKYYTVSARGAEVLKELLVEWDKMQQSISSICGKDEKNG
ncbi:MAG TPA: PadR family transcriptional regulator [Candidatus Cryosericum sp.]|nr:PadR family transcriptional regulator [Candidatus Cryosericum sp.]